MTNRIPVRVCAPDPILKAGLTSLLRPYPGVLVLDEREASRAQVTVVGCDTVTEETLRLLHTLRPAGGLALVTNTLNDDVLLKTVEAGVVGMLWRGGAGPEQLLKLVTTTASGVGSLPPEVLTMLMREAAALQHNARVNGRPVGSGLTDVEKEVLRLASDGFPTDEIATRLHRSPRTIKKVFYDIATRFHLRSRTHAVAYALRRGWI